MGFRATNCLNVQQNKLSQNGRKIEMDFVAINFPLRIKQKKQPNWQIREEWFLSKSTPLADKPVFITIFCRHMLGHPAQFVCLFVFGATAPSGPWPPHSLGF
jgi:hypothetical protein